MGYGNTKLTSMHLYSRRWNVVAQVAEELETVTYATPPIEERRERETNTVEKLMEGLGMSGQPLERRDGWEG